jgi:hypothetical protein
MKPLKSFFWIVLTAVTLLIVATEVTKQSPQEQKHPEPEIPFDRMTPAQHLEKAKTIMNSEDPLKLTQYQIQEATRHIGAIPDSAPESAEAITLSKHSIEAAKQKYLERVRQQYTHELESRLRQQGFDIVVTQLGDQLILADDLFKDETNRIQFLATIRKSRDAQGLCDVGFRQVALSGRGVLAGSNTYSLGCKPKKKAQ